MASGVTPSIFESSAEVTNGVKLMRLIVDGGTEALRQTFARHRAGDLQVELSTFQTTLSGLKGKYIKQNQWDKLYPTPPSKPNINDFDITLMCILLRNICGLSPPNSPVWDNEPTASNHSVEADIVRIRLFRNEHFGHIPNTAVSSVDFKTYWTEVSSTLFRLGIDQGEINRLENEKCGREETERVFKLWNECETETSACLRRIEHQVGRVAHDLQAIASKQEFRSESILDKQLVYFDFQPEIKMHSEKLTEGTREWVFEQVFTWCGDESSDNRAFVISALAGMGKSVVAAVICKRLAEHIGACHFFQYNNSRYNNPNSLLQSLAWQLCSVIPAFKEALIQKLSGNLGQSLNNMNAEGLFSLLFKEPFSSIAGSGKRVLIVLDALDESEHEGRQDLANLIANHFHKLPSYIRFLITTRPEKNLIGKFGKLNPLFIDAHDERNLSDIRLVLQKRISCPGGSKADIIDSLAEKSDGLMLYAFFLSEIYVNEPSVVRIDSFPQGLGEFYEKYLERLERELKDLLEISEDTFLSFLGALAVAMEPLPLAFIGSMFGFNKSSPSTKTKVKSALSILSSVLVVKENKSISFFHKSIRDWLVDDSELAYMVDEQHGHKVLFDLCVKELNELKETYVKDEAQVSVAIQYALKYYIRHMLNRTKNKDKLEYFVKNFVADLEVMFASVCVDVDLTLSNVSSLMNHALYKHVSEKTRINVTELFFVVKRFSFLLRDYPQSFLQHAVNECDEKFSLIASNLLKTRYKNIAYLEFNEKNRKNVAVELRCLLSGTISGIDVSPEHDYIVCSYQEGGIELFSLATGKSDWKIQNFTEELPVFQTSRIYGAHMLPHCIVFYRDENLILPGRLDMVITLKGKLMKTELFQCCDNDAKFTNSCFSKDGTRLVTNYGLDLIVWNTINGEKEICINCSSQLVTFSFTASGRFLGTTNADNAFAVYDVMGKYNLVKSVTIPSYGPLEILSTFHENSWCCFVNRFVTIVNHDLELSSRRDVLLLVLPCNLYSSELQCFLENPEQSWFSKIMKRCLSPFIAGIALRYIAIQDVSVLLFQRMSGDLLVFSIEKLINAEEQAWKDHGLNLSPGISANGFFYYFANIFSNKVTVRSLESDFSHSIPYPDPGQRDILVVRDGVILCGKNRTPTLWNCDLTKSVKSFHELSGIKQCLSISEELIACVYKSYIIFFDVVHKKVVSRLTFAENIWRVLACSTKYHVLAEMESRKISLWKDGVLVDGWAAVLSVCSRLGDTYSSTFSPDGSTLALPNSNTCIIFDVTRMSIKFHVQFPMMNKMGFVQMKFFNDENLLYLLKHTLYLINVGNGEILTCLDFNDFPGRLSVSRERRVVCIGHDRSEKFELIKVWLPRSL